jgi:vanillate O-demethylase monooxygenase subunit
MAFLRNVWYPFAWGEEVGRDLFGRTLLNEPIVAYRKEDGTAVALADTCPHRFAPLHKGKLVGDCVQCPYHGLQFNDSGACVHNPHGDGRIPVAAKVKSYPLVERDTLLWIWMGKPDEADPSTIVDFSCLNNKSYAYTNGRVMRMPIRQELMLDNLLDLTHAAYLHPTNLGSAAVANGRMTVTQTGNTVLAKNLYPDGLPAAVFSATGACSADQPVDYWVDVRWDPPACMYFDAGVTPAGRPRSEGALLSSAQLLAPESETSTHYFWRVYRNYLCDQKELTAGIEAAVAQAFATEDEPMILAVQDRMAGRDLWALKPVLLSTDTGAVRVRRLIAQMFEEEAKREPAAA